MSFPQLNMQSIFSRLTTLLIIIWLITTGILYSIILILYVSLVTILSGWIFFLKDRVNFKEYLYRILKAQDQVGNAILNGSEDETISSRAGKNRKNCLICRILCAILNKIDPGHCKESIEYDENS